MTDHPTRIAYAQALEILQSVAHHHRLPLERLATARLDGRIAAEDVVAPIALPAFDNSAMDGFAVRCADLGAAPLRLVAEQFAGQASETHCTT
ncbi:molybdopterin molybdenumtransferase MoeA, partial [Xanthomonas sp. Kuri4-1]